MGESIVESPKVECKMGETVTSVPTFQQSVSFGRFELDSLCWEKWSTFPTNKYLDEVEKCSTPGSVAQKKAYFEAHYKSIAARRAELLMDQERERETELVNPDCSAVMSSGCNASEEELHNVNSVNRIDQRENENDIVDFHGEVSVEHITVTSDGDSIVDEASVEHVHVNRDTFGVSNQENKALDLPSDISEHIDDSLTVNDINEPDNLTREKYEDVHDINNSDKIIHIHEVSEAGRIEVMNDNDQINDVILDVVVNKEVIEHLGEPNEGADLVKGSDKSPEDEVSGEDLCVPLRTPELGQLLKPVSVKDGVARIGDELPQEKVKRTISEEKSKNLISLATPKKMHKATSVKKSTMTTNAKTKPASPIPKRTTAPMPRSPMFSTSKSVKPELTKVTKSPNRLLDKKETSFTSVSSKKSIGPRSNRVVPTSLHMSLNLGPVNSNQESLTRKSLIMEKMADKDIVKRAFKSFQNTPQTPPSSLNKSPATNQSVSRKTESQRSSANTLPKKFFGIGRAAPTTSTRTGQQGTRNMLMSLGVKKDGAADQRKVNSISTSFGRRIQVEGNIQKEVSKKLELKPRSNVSEVTNLQSKLKVDKASQVKNLSQSIDSKPKLPSSYNRRIAESVHKNRVLLYFLIQNIYERENRNRYYSSSYALPYKKMILTKYAMVDVFHEYAFSFTVW
ncbi:hypothetical protein KSS87_020270 [Heliosperma pusillum]|nr:hypothetical protein KSS87_020270 [Heliosperma pusillum]